MLQKLRGDPAPTHAALVEDMIGRFRLVALLDDLEHAAADLSDARERAFKARRAADAAKAQQQQAEAHYTLQGLEGANAEQRAACLAKLIVAHPDYPQWQRCRQDAAQAQHDAEQAQTRWDTAKAALRAAAAAVGALGGGVMAEHTPGPWAVGGPEGRYITTPDGRAVADAWRFAVGAADCTANARLIAAAPALLACCEAVVNYIDTPPAIAHQLRRAIAQARGEGA